MNKKLFVLSLLAVFSLVFAACGTKTPAATEAVGATEPPVVATEPPVVATEAPPAEPHVLKIATSATITTWDPIASFSTEAQYLSNMYEHLLLVNPPDSPERFKPVLATSWEKTDDGLVWTFHLRENVKFHDGEPMNAAAVKKSIDVAKEKAAANFIYRQLDSVEAVDDLTVKFTLKEPAPLELILGAEYASYIISPKALDAAAANENYWSTGVEAGTGPYMIESYTPDQELVMTAYMDYWGGWKPEQFEKVVVSFVPEATTRLQLFQSGEVDLITTLPVDSYPAFESDPNYTVLVEPSTINYVGYFNTMKAPLDNVKVRQALSYAVPYEDLVKISVSGRGAPARGPVPAGIFPWSEKINQYPYDLEKAKALLAEAGVKDLKLTLTYASSNSVEEAFVPLIKDSYAQIGVDLTIQPLNWGEQWDLAYKGDPLKAQDIFVVQWWPTYDASYDNLWSMFYGVKDPPHINSTTLNLAYWYDEKYNALYDEGAALNGKDMDAALAKFVEAQNYLVEQAPSLYLFDQKIINVIPNYIQGFKYDLNYADIRFWYYDLSTTK